ncbi:hypothetical protein [Yersinia mollaretii]|uniref:hypothetical protein n=1 Tax=Yersinia mollaretii TaxID=33060 RepID=UPI0005E0EDB0|nr:hypothetical protein [Yersinia mollaretii]CNF48515.1 Uncharacterised protein [Yersinia mollaretii]
MASPRLKVDERFDELLEKYHAKLEIDEIHFHTIKNEMKGINSPQAIATMALAYATFDKLDMAIESMESWLQYADVNFATLYCSLLFRNQDFKKIHSVIYDFADKYSSKWLTFNAASFAYSFGYTSLCGEFMDKHIRLISDDEGRDMAVKHKEDVLNDLYSAYEKSGCTPAQFELIGLIAHKIMGQYSMPSSKVEVSGRNGGDYVIDIDTKDADMVVEMNKKLAEAICLEDGLDGCNLIARFTPDRNQKPGVAYVYK